MASILKKKLQRPSGSNNSIDSGCYDVRNALHQFVKSGTGVFTCNIGIQVDEEIVKVKLNKELITTNNEDSNCSGIEDGDDCVDGVDGVIEREGAKINEVECGTFSHGFGLRDGDIMLSVNDYTVKSAAMAASMIKHIVKYSKNSKLRMEIYRREKGLIILDNGGDDLSALDDNDLIRIQQTTSTLKNDGFTKYLMVMSSKIKLSNFRTKPADKQFNIVHYAQVIGSSANKYVALKHKKTGKWIAVKNSNVTLEPAPPGNGYTLQSDSIYLFNLVSLSGTSYVTLQPVNETEKAIGFTGRRHPATLISPSNINAFFQVFTSTTSS